MFMSTGIRKSEKTENVKIERQSKPRKREWIRTCRRRKRGRRRSRSKRRGAAEREEEMDEERQDPRQSQHQLRYLHGRTDSRPRPPAREIGEQTLSKTTVMNSRIIPGGLSATHTPALHDEHHHGP